MIIDWLNSYDPSKSIDWNQATLTNWYLVANKRGKLPLAAMPTPGTTLFASSAGTVVRGGYVYNNILYVVIDNKLYSVASTGVKTELGTLTTSSGHLGKNKWATITDQLIVIDGAHGYHYNTSTAIFTQIVDVDFPGTATSITAQDDYFLVSKPNSPIVTYSDISDGLSWNALNIVQKTRVASDVTGVVAVHGQIHFIGPTSIEPYFNSGAPFERSQDSLLYVGTDYIETYCMASDASVFFLSKQAGGGPFIAQAKGDQAVPVSSSIDYQLKQLTTLSDAFSYIYRQEQQEWYCITFPTDMKTFCYDLTTSSWHARESYVSGVYRNHRASFVDACYSKIIMGDLYSGNLYYLDTDVYTEAGTAIRRTLVTYPFYQESKYVTGNRLIVEFETGVGSNSDVDVSFSKDNGHTYVTFTPTRNIGVTYGARSLLFDRLGSARQWNFKVQTTMTDKCIMLGAVGDFRVGRH